MKNGLIILFFSILAFLFLSGFAYASPCYWNQPGNWWCGGKQWCPCEETYGDRVPIEICCGGASCYGNPSAGRYYVCCGSSVYTAAYCGTGLSQCGPDCPDPWNKVCYNSATHTCVADRILKKNNGQSCSADYECADKYCNSGVCASCSGGNLQVCGSNWNNYNCYDNSIEACTDNTNGITKKRFGQSCSANSECVGNYCESSKCAGIYDIVDLKLACPYDSSTRTYSCMGFENIKIINDISLPTADCWYTRACRRDGELGGCNPRNIIFKANNEFSAKNFYATNGGGYGGYITIEAKKITATSLNTYGTACRSTSCTCGGPFCGNSNGGDVTLKADSVNVGTINANQGGGAMGSGGKVTITANTTSITNIYSNGGGYTCSYDYGGDNGAGTGGTVIIKSGTASINSISLNGASRNYASGGTGAGSANISAGTLNLGTINADGAPGSQGQGSGGNIKIYNDVYTLSSISASGPGGFIGFFTDSAYPTALSASTIKTGKRTGGGFYIFETSLPSQYKSFRARIKDTVSGAYVKSIYDVEWFQTGVISSGYIKEPVGFATKLNSKLGSDNLLELRVSPDAVFDESRCSSVGCATYFVPYTVY